MKQKLIQLWQLSFREQCLLVEASFCLGFARLMVLTVSFRRFAPWLGKHMKESSYKIDSSRQKKEAIFISEAIHRVSPYLPWTCNCLAKAIAGKAMLKLRKIPSTLYLGVAKEDNKHQLIAHAWLRCGNQILTGKPIQKYTPISSFAELNKIKGQ